MTRMSEQGRRLESCCLKSVRGVEASTGRDKVVGRPSPGKVVTKTFIIWGDMTGFVFESSFGVVDNELVINAILYSLESVKSIAYRLELAATPDFKRLGVLRLINPHTSADHTNHHETALIKAIPRSTPGTRDHVSYFCHLLHTPRYQKVLIHIQAYSQGRQKEGP